MSTFDDICREEAEAGETVVVATPKPTMHRYIEMLRQLLVARNTVARLRCQLDSPRVGILLKLVQEAAGLNQEQLARRLGVAPTYLSKVANEREKAGVELLEALYFEWEKTQTLEMLPRVQRLANEWPD